MARFYENPMNQSSRPTARPRMTSKAGGTQDSGAGQRPGALTARGGTGYTAPIPSPRQMPRTPRSRTLTESPPRIASGDIPRQDEGPEAQNFANILFGPGALQARGGSGYQGLDTRNMRDAARVMAIQSRMQMPEEPRVRDMPDMSVEEMAPYNRPADDINDAFFGPNRERFDVIEFLMGLMGRR
jgi:hypothetical protein